MNGSAIPRGRASSSPLTLVDEMASPHPVNHDPRDCHFLTNHAMVLINIWKDPHSTVRNIARRVGITERATQKILRTLIDGGYVARERVGASNRYVVDGNREMNHPHIGHREVSRLLDAMT